MNCILFKIVFLATLSLFVCQLGAAESSNYQKSKKHTLSVCAIVKNEAKYLKEWIEFHRLVGVDHFYLYNNGNIDSVQKVLSPYIRKGIVTFIDWSYFPYTIEDEKTCHWSLSTQIPAYENAIKFRAFAKN